VTPQTFCAAMEHELGQLQSDEGGVRGARGLCEMYAATDAQRFEAILNQMAGGAVGWVLADGARWLLQRWQAGAEPTPSV
jgi:hypothetical protein